MATMVVLVDGDVPNVPLDARAVSALGRLGVTNLTLVQDERTVAIVLEGWGFDVGTSAVAAVEALSSNGRAARVLHPVGQMAITAGRANATGASPH